MLKFSIINTHCKYQGMTFIFIKCNDFIIANKLQLVLVVCSFCQFYTLVLLWIFSENFEE